MQKRQPIQLFLTIPILSWAMYDFANTIFSANVVTLFFPQYVTEMVGDNARLEQIASTIIAYANAAAAMLLIIFSPLFGVLMDRTGKRQPFVVIMTICAVLATVGMGFFGGINTGTIAGLPNGFVITILLFIIARFFYNSGNVFYDGMLSSLGTKQEIPLISGYGVALGYIGTIFGVFSVKIILGGQDTHHTFWLSGVLFLLFALPLFFINKDPHVKKTSNEPFHTGYKDIFNTFKEAKRYPSIFFFMIAYFFVNDALATAIAMMQPYATTVVGFTPDTFIIMFLVATLFSIIGAMVFGFVNQKFGSKLTFLYISIILSIALIIAAVPLPSYTFWVAGSLFGVAMGSVWVVSRTIIIELSPEGKEGQFFGLFAFSAKVSAIIGPLIYGTITLALSDYDHLASRVAISSLLVMVIIGTIFHMRVKSSDFIQR